jgi:hypothetical protein
MLNHALFPLLFVTLGSALRTNLSTGPWTILSLMRRLTFIILFVSVFISLKAQDLTGTWEGLIGGREYAKLCIIRYKDNYVGFTYDEGSGFCRAHFDGLFTKSNQKLKGVNTSFIERTPNHVLSRYNLDYSKIEGKEYLTGIISDKSATGFLLSFGMGSGVTYTRVSRKVDTTEYMRLWLAEISKPVTNTPDRPIARANTKPEPPVVKKDTVVTKPQPPVIAIEPPRLDTARKPVADNSIITAKNKRSTDTLSVIEIRENKLTIKVMDNGVVDGDTVSIIHNGQVIANKLSVSLKPFEITIPVDRQHDRHEIVLVAHNLGSIPPNTAMILIETQQHQYRLTASTDLGKNAMIIFRYKEP